MCKHGQRAALVHQITLDVPLILHTIVISGLSCGIRFFARDDTGMKVPLQPDEFLYVKAINFFMFVLELHWSVDHI